ncbi:MAG: polysaccharide biosynthesis protein [Vicinamibacteria bacterium]|nr:polysaccharide biosynthesis protein [Vicinamibacteria bacterium]
MTAGERSPAAVIVIGAGSAGALVARTIAECPEMGLAVVGFVDDSPDKQERSVEGLPVLGVTADLPGLVSKTGASLAVLAMPSAPGPTVRRIVTLCRELRLALRTVPSLAEILSGAAGVATLREIDASDLLQRSPAPHDPAAGDYLRGARVLVSGAGGSIGTELCRQILRFAPASLVLLDVAENALYEVDRHLRERAAATELVPVLGSVGASAWLHRLLEQQRPNVVFHAAARKHVPLSELNPDEAVLTNVFGTRNLLQACEAFGVERLVHVSTDKAVTAAGVMGASKRIAEQLVSEAARRSGSAFVAVRFGNVLGSSGSVVPLFREQIARGGPVTVGHPDLERYFMTIAEAVSLLVAAGDLGCPGDLFVLDMGPPVRIVSLAQDLMRLSGLAPERDADIVFTGLRPGEALREALFLDAEEPAPTRNPRIRVARPRSPPSPLAPAALVALEAAALRGDPAEIRRRLRDLVPAYPGRPREAPLASTERGWP